LPAEYERRHLEQVDEPVHPVDLMPTLLDYAGEIEDKLLQGKLITRDERGQARARAIPERLRSRPDPASGAGARAGGATSQSGYVR
jgi:arylsulfatase A-like enzyme